MKSGSRGIASSSITQRQDLVSEDSKPRRRIRPFTDFPMLRRDFRIADTQFRPLAADTTGLVSVGYSRVSAISNNPHLASLLSAEAKLPPHQARSQIKSKTKQVHLGPFCPWTTEPGMLKLTISADTIVGLSL
ncbi:MAG: hypothetical protein AAGA97_10625 [Pseudomonadota bacterium]